MNPQEYLKELLVNSGIKQKHMAEAIGVSMATMSNIINGRTGISKNIAFKLESKYGISSKFLLEGVGEPFGDDGQKPWIGNALYTVSLSAEVEFNVKVRASTEEEAEEIAKKQSLLTGNTIRVVSIKSL